MKKILYITTVSGTINAFLSPHIKMLIDDGYKVDCACKITVPISDDLINLGIKVFNIPFSRNPLDINNMKALKELSKIQNENEYDFIHVHTPVAGLYGRLLKLKFHKLKTIYTAHGFHFYKGAPKQNWLIYYPIEKIMAKFTDIIITMNEEDYNSALKFNIKNVYKINGVGLDLNKYNPTLYDKYEVRKELGLSKDDFVILMIAEINKNKNHIQMIKAIEILKNKGINVKVLCAGRGPLLENIEQEIINRNLESNVFMLGFRSDIPKLISACDIGMLLSYREGLPRNIMELMAYGKPVIGTNIRGIRDIIKNDYNGFIVDIGDSLSTSRFIEKYISFSKVEKEKMILNCINSIDIYSIENILADLTYILNMNLKGGI